MIPQETESVRTPLGLERVTANELLKELGCDVRKPGRPLGSTNGHKQGLSSTNPFAFESRAGELSDVIEAYENSPDKFYNDSDPSYVVLEEKPEHRMMVFLKARGLSNIEIGERMRYSHQHVSQLVRQPWFKLRLVQELSEAGRDQLTELFKVEAINSALKLVELRDDPETPRAVVKSSCDSLLDRFLGKPIAKVETSEHKLPSTEETRKIDQQLAEIDKELSQTTNEPIDTSHETTPAS